MKVVSGGQRASLYGGRFTGRVELEMLVASPDGVRPDTALGHFHDGAVTNWHAHPGGQLLWVVSGTARVGTEADGEVLIEPGTLVATPAGERHWHGAAPGQTVAVLSITWGTTAWEDAAGGGS